MRNILAMFALFSVVAGFAVFVTSVMLMVALRKVLKWVSDPAELKIFSNNEYSQFQEYERQFHPWLWAFGVFAVLRFLAFLFFSIVNDLTFAYNLFMFFFWFIMVGVSFYAWTLVYTLYLELSGLTKLEDLAQLRVSELQ